MIFFFTFRIFPVFHLSIAVLIWSKGSVAEFTIEEKVQELTDNYVVMKETLESKVTLLEEKVTRLEFQVFQQDFLLISLQNKLLKTEGSRLSTAVETNISLQTERNAIFRTCHEVRAVDPSLTSGMYYIDPDGQGVGDDPINVYCDMTTGASSIPHDSESQINVGHCETPGCYSRIINYSATNRQMTVLADLSSECHQSIKYDCNYAPFEFDGVSYSWWNDREGKAQYFWAGSNPNVHTCQCGIENNCVETSRKCNCDSALPIPQQDNGVIVNKDILPITRLNFGRTLLESSSGVHTLGRFECSGKVTVAGMPTSCEDLWRIGHTLNGFYSVTGTKQIESVYCDFTKLPGDSSFQKWIGYESIKSHSVYFYVQRSTHFNTTSTPIPFEVELLNIGGSMNIASGNFTAPRSGTYFFSFIGLASIPASTNRTELRIGLYLNGVRMGLGFSDEVTTAHEYDTLFLQSTLNLKAGDKIWLQIEKPQFAGVFMYDTLNDRYTHFTGWLLDEDISQSLRYMV